MSQQDTKSASADSLSYRAAGVDIDAGNELVERIKPHVKSTRRAEVLGGLGGFGALFELPLDRYKNPVLVSGTDGVGTKLKLAIDTGKHDTIGIDLVAMCANDLIVQGAEPLFFLDYYATGKLDVDVAEDVVKGICDGCNQSGMALIGGETAEMPGMYNKGDYDLAGFCVGIVEKDNIITGQDAKTGDVLVGVASSGPHSNGYSLIRKVLETNLENDPDFLQQEFNGSSYGETLLAPTRIYVKAVLELLKQVKVKSISHITGGGLLENLPRVLPHRTCAKIERQNWVQPPIFTWLQEQGNISATEMLRTFNCGVGLVVCVAPDDVHQTIDILNAQGENAFVVGHLESRMSDDDDAVVLS